MATEEKQEIRFQSNHMNTVEVNKPELLEHIASCDSCAASYAEMIEKTAMIKAPHYMKGSILQRSKEIAADGKERRGERADSSKYYKRIQLFRYSLKVGLAMCGALAMVFFSSFNSSVAVHTGQWPADTGQLEEKYPVRVFIDKMNTGMRIFSDNMVFYTDSFVSGKFDDMEVNKNDKKKE